MLRKLQDIPARDRAKTIQLELGEVIPHSISAEEWIRARSHKYFLIAFVVLLITASAIGAIAMREGRELAKAAEQVRLRQEEMKQRQDARQEEMKQRQDAIQAKRRDLQVRQEALDDKIVAAEMEFRRGAMGLRFAPEDQKQIAMEIMRVAAAEKEKLLEEKKKLQALIDDRNAAPD